MKKLSLLLVSLMLLSIGTLAHADETEMSNMQDSKKDMPMSLEDKEAITDMTEDEKAEYFAEKKAEFDALSDEEKAARLEEMEAKKSEMQENKQERVEDREEYKETITGLKDEAKELRAERKTARQEYISAAKENLTKRIEAKGARLSQIPTEKLASASTKIVEMIEKYEANEKLSDEIKNVILDQLYALQDMIDSELEAQ